MQGEVSTLAETNVLDKQLQSGQLEMPTIVDLVKESELDDVRHEEGGQGGNSTTVVQNGYYNNVVCNSETCHQETQTDFFTLSVAESVFAKANVGDKKNCEF